MSLWKNQLFDTLCRFSKQCHLTQVLRYNINNNKSYFVTVGTDICFGCLTLSTIKYSCSLEALTLLFTADLWNFQEESPVAKEIFFFFLLQQNYFHSLPKNCLSIKITMLLCRAVTVWQSHSWAEARPVSLLQPGSVEHDCLVPPPALTSLWVWVKRYPPGLIGGYIIAMSGCKFLGEVEYRVKRFNSFLPSLSQI